MGILDFIKNESEKIWKILKVYGGYSVDRELIDLMVKLVPSGTLLEFGSGRATEVFSKYYTVYSVEENPEWLNKYNSNYIHAPIKNLEVKNEFDIIFNYDSDSDTLNFGDIPNRWGEDTLTIEYTTSSFNLDFDLYLSLEEVTGNADYLTWYKYEYTTESNTITLNGLQDDTRYYFYAVSSDLAGNIEDPLSSTEYYSSNGLYDQQIELKYIPLMDWGYTFSVEIDDNLDGTYETILIRGEDQSRLKSNEYYLDLDTKTIIFGGLSNGGFVPSEDLNSINNVRIIYSGVQGIFEVYTGEPESASALNIVPSNTTELVVSFVVPKDSLALFSFEVSLVRRAMC